jgi:hypothetical protein
MDKPYYVTHDAPHSANCNASIVGYDPPPPPYILNTKRI